MGYTLTLDSANRPDTHVETVKTTSIDAAYNFATFYEIFGTAIQRSCMIPTPDAVRHCSDADPEPNQNMPAGKPKRNGSFSIEIASEFLMTTRSRREPQRPLTRRGQGKDRCKEPSAQSVDEARLTSPVRDTAQVSCCHG